MTLEPLPIAANAHHLTAALRQAGVLGDGHVSSVAVESSRSMLLSRVRRLRLSYGETVDAPKTVILKSELPERAQGTGDAGHHEVEFYTKIAGAMPERLVPRCFGADWNSDTKAWHILLEDLGNSHVIATTWPLPPTMEQCESILRAHARFQAAWWDDSRLGVSVGTWLSTEAIDHHVQSLAEKFAHFADRLGDRLPRGRVDLFNQVIDAAPRLLTRACTRRNLTIVHGDAHIWNCFLPRNAGSDDVRLFDWDSWRIGIGSNDLAYMMAVHWYPDLRRERERPLLDHYHATLLAHGVRGYDRRALDADYRLSVLWQITTPVWQAAHDIPPVIWWNNLGRILLAVDDLHCRDLLV